MRPGRLLAGFAASVAITTALACGDVPTLPDGVAYISAIVSPSLAVAAGDSLRDSLGHVAPLRVFAIGRNGDTLPGIPVVFRITSFDTGIKIDNTTGYLLASDSVRAVRIVGQVINLLQTPEYTLQVVPQPDSLQQAIVNDSIRANATLQAIVSDSLTVTVSGLRNGARVGVPFILLQYQIARLVPATAGAGLPDSVFALVNDLNRFDPKAPRFSLDTTNASGTASRRVRVSTDAFDSVFVTVTAKDLKGQLLKGSPATFALVRGF
jgi:hypothetical protein